MSSHKECECKYIGYYGGFKKNGSHRLTGNNTMRRYGLVQVGVDFLEVVCLCRQPLRSHMLKSHTIYQALPAAFWSRWRTLSYLSNTMYACMSPYFPP